MMKKCLWYRFYKQKSGSNYYLDAVDLYEIQFYIDYINTDSPIINSDDLLEKLESLSKENKEIRTKNE